MSDAIANLAGVKPAIVMACVTENAGSDSLWLQRDPSIFHCDKGFDCFDARRVDILIIEGRAEQDHEDERERLTRSRLVLRQGDGMWNRAFDKAETFDGATRFARQRNH